VTDYDTLKGDLLATSDAIYQQGLTDQQGIDSTTLAALNATIAALRTEEADDEATIAQLQAELAALQNPPPPPPPPPANRVDAGVYTSGQGTNPDVDTLTANWSKKPTSRSAYIAPFPGTTAGFVPSVPAKLKTPGVRFAHVGLSTKAKFPWTDFTAGKVDTETVAYLKLLNSLGYLIVVCVENEPDLKIDVAADTIPGQTPAQHVAATQHLAKLIKDNGLANLSPGVWLAGSGAQAKSFLVDPAIAPHLGVDPYLLGDQPATETATTTWGRYFTRVGVDPANTKYILHIFETAVVNNGKFTDAQMVSRIATMPQAVKDLHLASVTIFWANSGTRPYVPTSSQPTVIKAYQDALAGMISG